MRWKIYLEKHQEHYKYMYEKFIIGWNILYIFYDIPD